MGAVLGEVHETKDADCYDSDILELTNFIMINMGVITRPNWPFGPSGDTLSAVFRKVHETKVVHCYDGDNLKMINFILINMSAIASFGGSS